MQVGTGGSGGALGNVTNLPTRLYTSGTLIINRVVPEAKDIEKKLAYNPLILPDGIKPSSDPVLLYRPVVYAVSVGRRQ